MLRKRIEDRVGTVEDLGLATLLGYRLCFNKKSSSGSGKANIMKDESSKVLGVIYRLSEGQASSLDSEEKRYHRENLKVELCNKVVDAVAYVADADVINENLLPTLEYRQYIIDGAKEHDLPPDYVKSLERTPLFVK